MATFEDKNQIKKDMKPKRAYPFHYLPDEFWAILGSLILGAFLLPTFAFVGGPLILGETLFFLLKKLVPNLTLAALEKKLEPLGKRTLLDPRNVPYLIPIFFLSVYAPALFLFFMYYYLNYGFEWKMFLLYHCLRTGPRYRFFTWNHVLVHKEAHDHAGFFKGQWTVLNNVCNWWIGLFYGVVPNSYAISHNKIHHKFDNGLSDVHTNWDLDRTQPYSFLLYIPRFAAYWTSISPLWYFSLGIPKPEKKFVAQLVYGLLYYLGFAYVIYKITDFTFAFCFFVLPLPEAVVFLGGVSYIWHAFIDPSNYQNEYVTSMTIINGRENMWNEDYHVEHHCTPHLHWTQYPVHYEENKHLFEQNKATIFTETEEGELFFLLISKNWDKLAEKFVDLSGKMNVEEKKKLLLERLSHTVAS